MNEDARTDFLVSNSRFLLGVGSVLNLKGGLAKFNSFPSGAEADYYAIRSDWEMVGNDISKATEVYSRTKDKNAPSR